MFAKKHYPEILLPQELDQFLARGWYRMGQTIFTTHFLCFDQEFYSAIWVRLDLQGFQFRKSLRKVMRRNKAAFHYKIQRAVITQEKEMLYQKYRASFPGTLAPSLRESLLDGEDTNIYNTYEVQVLVDDRLVALSYFDLGENSLSSITGIYDPHFQKFSLGFFTMLLEIEYGLQNGYRYFYPGYVVPGYDRFDYKLRIGDVDYYDLATRKWLPYHQLSADQIPIRQMRYKLRELSAELDAAGVPNKVMLYPLFEANLFGFWVVTCLDFPIFLWSYPRRNAKDHLAIVYDPRIAAYRVLNCSLFEDIQFYFRESYARSFDQERYFMDLLVMDRDLGRATEAKELAQLLSRLPRRIT